MPADRQHDGEARENYGYDADDIKSIESHSTWFTLKNVSTRHPRVLACHEPELLG
jgi:hypothetical protein